MLYLEEGKTKEFKVADFWNQAREELSNGTLWKSLNTMYVLTRTGKILFSHNSLPSCYYTQIFLPSFTPLAQSTPSITHSSVPAAVGPFWNSWSCLWAEMEGSAHRGLPCSIPTTKTLRHKPSTKSSMDERSCPSARKHCRVWEKHMTVTSRARVCHKEPCSNSQEHMVTVWRRSFSNSHGQRGSSSFQKNEVNTSVFGFFFFLKMELR